MDGEKGEKERGGLRDGSDSERREEWEGWEG